MAFSSISTGTDQPGKNELAAGSLLEPLFATPIYGLLLSGSAPDRLTIAPTDPWPGDAQIGSALIAGTYGFAGQEVAAASPPWTSEAVDDAFLDALHGFGWLRDLRAAGGDVARSTARRVIGDWIDRQGRWKALSWRPDIAGMRLSMWLGTYDFHAASADDAYRARLLASATKQARHLSRTAPGKLPGAPALTAIKGLIYAAICLPDSRIKLSGALRLLWRELDSQVLADGNHIQRRPSLHLSVLRDLIDLRTLICRCDAPESEDAVERLKSVIDRMGPALRFFRHGDGRLAVFNGGQEADPVLIDSVLAQADAPARPIRRAEDTGFERAVCGRATLIFDVGAPPPPAYRHGTHAGLMAFELSVGRERLVVNCGALPGLDHPTGIVRVGTRGPLAQWRDGLRTTVAHSTVGVGDADSVAIGPGLSAGRPTPDVAIHRTDNQGAVLLAGRADGYADQFGLVHHRTLYLTAAGDRLTGEDVLSGPGGHDFSIRFHLHPKVRASLVTGGDAILLRTTAGEGWKFKTAGGAMALEESAYWATTSGGPRRTNQIVVTGTTQGGATTLRWSFCREGSAKK